MSPGKRLSEAQTMPSSSKRRFLLKDPDVLECPICSEDLAPPVFQCPSGHTACADCWVKIDSKKCPSCQKPVGNNRNVAVEKILESLFVSCKNSPHGCNKLLRYTKKAEHETTSCEYQVFNCVFDGCEFKGFIYSFRLHFKEEHQAKTVNYNDQFILKPTDDYIFVRDDDHHHLLVVHREKQNTLGDKFFCASFGPCPMFLKLAVSVKGGPCRSYTLETRVCDIQRSDDWKRNFLLIPQSAHGLENCEFQGRLGLLNMFEDTNLPDDD